MRGFWPYHLLRWWQPDVMSGRVALFVARKAVIRDLIPGRPRGYEGVELRPDPGLAVERAEADRDFFALRPLCTEETRAADRAEGFHASAVRPEDADQLLTGEQAESFARDASLRSAEGARVLPAPRAVAVIGPPERRRHLELDTAAEARAVERVLGAWLCSHGANRSRKQRYALGLCVLPFRSLLLGDSQVQSKTCRTASIAFDLLNARE